MNENLAKQFESMIAKMEEGQTNEDKLASSLVIADFLEEHGFDLRSKLFRFYARIATMNVCWSWHWLVYGPVRSSVSEVFRVEVLPVGRLDGGLHCLGHVYIKRLFLYYHSGKRGDRRRDCASCTPTVLDFGQPLYNDWRPLEPSWGQPIIRNWMLPDVHEFLAAVNKSRATRSKPTPIGFFGHVPVGRERVRDD